MRVVIVVVSVVAVVDGEIFLYLRPGQVRSKMATKLHPILGLAPFVSAAASEIIFKAIDSTGSGVISRAQVIQAQPLSFFCFDIFLSYEI